VAPTACGKRTRFPLPGIADCIEIRKLMIQGNQSMAMGATTVNAGATLGGTTIEGGTVSIAADENLGAAAGAVTLDGGTLQTTADDGADLDRAPGQSGERGDHHADLLGPRCGRAQRRGGRRRRWHVARHGRR
jgi:hypothetical protein